MFSVGTCTVGHQDHMLMLMAHCMIGLLLIFLVDLPDIVLSKKTGSFLSRPDRSLTDTVAVAVTAADSRKNGMYSVYPFQVGSGAVAAPVTLSYTSVYDTFTKYFTTVIDGLLRHHIGPPSDGVYADLSPPPGGVYADILPKQIAELDYFANDPSYPIPGEWVTSKYIHSPNTTLLHLALC